MPIDFCIAFSKSLFRYNLPIYTSNTSSLNVSILVINYFDKLYQKKLFEKAIQKSIGIHFKEIVIAEYNVKEIAESIKRDILKSENKGDRDKLIKRYLSLGFYIIMVHHGDKKMVADKKGNVRNAKKVECEMK